MLPLPVDISPPVNVPPVHTTTSTGTPYAGNFTATTSTTGHPHVSAVHVVTPFSHKLG